MTVNIKFVDNMGHVPEKFHPVPAKNFLPEWYKKIPAHHSVDGSVRSASSKTKGLASTVKKCMPFFDVMTAGYIIVTPEDVEVSWDKQENTRFYQWPDWQFIDFHNPKQITGHPYNGNGDLLVPKFLNPWSVITPKGYSCMFIQPTHRDSIFSVFEGVVDTDVYHGAVELPFVLKEERWEGTIPAGTPIAQVIPFKREKYTHSIHKTQEFGYNVNNLAGAAVRSKFVNGYKEIFWAKKDYS